MQTLPRGFSIVTALTCQGLKSLL